MLHGRVKLGREHETNTNFLNSLGDLLGGEFKINPQRGQHIGRAALRRSGAVAMFCNFAAGSGQYKSRGGRDIKGIRAVTAGANNVIERLVAGV